MVCALITYLLLFYAEYTTINKVLTPFYDNTIFYKFHGILYSLIIFLATLSHFKAMTTNPGAIEKNAIPIDYDDITNKKNYKTCKRCTTYKPLLTHHCRICERCVLKMDHHWYFILYFNIFIK